MRILEQSQAVVLFDLSNVVARATAVAQHNFMGLLCRMLLKQRKRYPSHEFVFAVEGAGTLARQRVLPAYKDGRVPSPEFQDARNAAIKMLHYVACTLIKAPEGEADDAIATYTEHHPDADIIVVSNDRDLWQLISPNVRIQAKVGKDTIDVDRFACVRHLGVLPEAVPLMKALCGDSSDCIPRGVPRVHEKKLKQLAQAAADQEDRLDLIVDNADWLTDPDKKKIHAAASVVKQHLQVTRAWNNLQLVQRKYAGDVDGLLGFLEYHNADGLSREDVETIVGEAT